MTYVDLTMPLTPSTPVYPGDPAVTLTPTAEFARDGYVDHVLSLGTHNGTHIDAPAHMVVGGKTLQNFGVDRFIGPGVLIDATSGLTVDSLAHYPFEAGDIVLIRTGLSDALTDPAYPERNAGLTAELALIFVQHKVRMVGVDAISPDADPFPFHKTLLAANILLIENLVGLSRLQGRKFSVVALPLALHVEASPARVIATLV